jgi:hypothetical protein
MSFKVNFKTLINPFYGYPTIFIAVLLIYQLNVSTIYPKISIELYLFFMVTFILSLVFGLIFNQYFLNKILCDTKPRSYKIDFLFLLLIVLIFIEFYFKGIPIFNYFIFENSGHNYASYGIKTLHPLIFSFAAYYCLVIYVDFLNTKTTFSFLKLIFLFTYPLLVMNRGGFLILVMGILFTTIIFYKKAIVVKFKYLIFLILCMLSIFYFFGYLGEVRSGASTYSQVFKITEQVQSNDFLKKMSWPYMYLTSPIANLQKNISLRVDYNSENYLYYTFIPDFISKSFDSKKVVVVDKIAPELTVGTQYIIAYKTMGYFGMYLFFIFSSLLCFLYTASLSKKSVYSIAGYVVLLEIILFGFFDNMWIFSGLSFQLIYPILISFLHSIFSSKILKFKRLAL